MTGQCSYRRSASGSRITTPGEIDVTHGRILYLEDVSVSFDGFKAIDKLSLDIAPGEKRAGIAQNANVLADAMEAALGALYLDGGLEVARSFVRRAWAPAMDAMVLPPKDAKTALQEWLMARGRPLPTYTEEARSGPSHAPCFVVRVSAGTQSATGDGASKRVAEQAAAAALLQELRS